MKIRYEEIKQYVTHRSELSCGTFIRIERPDKTVQWYGLVAGLCFPKQPWVSTANLERVMTKETT